MKQRDLGCFKILEAIRFSRRQLRFVDETRNNSGRKLLRFEPVEADSTFRVVSQEDRVVAFRDRSFGEINSWFWDFGDGATTTDRHPIQRHATSGEFVVTVKLAGPDVEDRRAKVRDLTLPWGQYNSCRIRIPSGVRNENSALPVALRVQWHLNCGPLLFPTLLLEISQRGLFRC